MIPFILAQASTAKMDWFVILTANVVAPVIVSAIVASMTSKRQVENKVAALDAKVEAIKDTTQTILQHVLSDHRKGQR